MQEKRNTLIFSANPKKFTQVNVFDRIIVGKIYAEQNLDEWYDILFRLNDDEVKSVCRSFHMDIILNCVIMKERYSILLADKFASLN